MNYVKKERKRKDKKCSPHLTFPQVTVTGHFLTGVFLIAQKITGILKNIISAYFSPYIHIHISIHIHVHTLNRII